MMMDSVAWQDIEERRKVVRRMQGKVGKTCKEMCE
jgi:hypothetical protein